MIHRYELYCIYDNQSPECHKKITSLGRYVLWTDHADIFEKMKNCDNCRNNAIKFQDGSCSSCTGPGGSNWRMNES
jgi:hypothetical protein